MGSLKRVLSKVVKPVDSADPVWQRGFFDHVMRSAESYSQKWDYVRENPVRAGLVRDADEWPYSGEIVPL
jgi:putative transposase